MAEPIAVARDVLDKQIFDVNKVKVGKVDGLIVAVRANRPPRLIALELSSAAAWRRVHPKLGDWLERIQRRLWGEAADPVRIRFEHVVGWGIDVDVNIDATRTKAFAVESWLKKHVVQRLPGGRK